MKKLGACAPVRAELIKWSRWNLVGLVSMLVVHTLKGSMIRYHVSAQTPSNVLERGRSAPVHAASVRERGVSPVRWTGEGRAVSL